MNSGGRALSSLIRDQPFAFRIHGDEFSIDRRLLTIIAVFGGNLFLFTLGAEVLEFLNGGIEAGFLSSS